MPRSLVIGLLAGQGAGLAMAVFLMFAFRIFLGKGLLFPVQVIGSFVYGDAALQGFHAQAFLAGLALHQLGPSVAWGLVMGLGVWAFGVHGRRVVALAVGISLMSQLIDVNVMVPWASIALHGHDVWGEQVPVFCSWVAHAVFGLGLLVYPVIDRNLELKG